MKFSYKYRLHIIRDYCIGWVIAFIFLTFFRGSGTTELGSAQFDFLKSLIMSIILGLFFGSLSGIGQIITEEHLYKKISLRKLLSLKFVSTLFLVIILTLCAYLIVTLIFEINVGLLEFLIEPGSFAIYLYILLVEYFMFILRLINLMLGRNNLKKLLQGKFYNPREEERIFMFLDLKSSTKLAEKLGHIKYSRLIQDCFFDLGVVAQNDAEIYQYVGDEVILTWHLKEGLKNYNCVSAYYNFMNQLDKKKQYYNEKYNCVPFFKAGTHSGIVTVTEVGRYKKEIAFHGDTINTAARIQAKCNEYNEGLLISKSLMEKLDHDNYKFCELGSIALKGKEKEVVIYSVNKLQE